MQIDINIPLPTGRIKKPSKYAWADPMKVGHSVAFDDMREANRVYVALRNKFGNKRKWTLQTQEDNSIRIWRKL